LKIKTVDFVESLALDIEILNAIVAPKTFLKTSYEIEIGSD
jgi:hypothetical protein